jgi:hypothetical protein
VRIAPHPGSLPAFTATYPHPQGTIRVEFHRQGAFGNAIVTLPGTLTGSFVFDDRTWALRSGVNHIPIQFRRK